MPKFDKDVFENDILNKIKIRDKTSLSIQRTRAILGEMAKKEIIIAEGTNKNRKYRLKN